MAFRPLKNSSNRETPTPGAKNETYRRLAVNRYVLDSFALTAYLENEPGRLKVSEVIREVAAATSRALMTTVNLGETLYMMERRRGPTGLVHALGLVPQLGIEVIDTDLKLTVAAARIKAVTPISYGDCFAAALALEEDAVLLTGDTEFRRLQAAIKIEWLPQR